MCTRILDNSGDTVVVARTMDWPDSTAPMLTAFPRGISRSGGSVGSVEVLANNPLTWTSHYGSLVTTMYSVGTADGMNEAGLAVHMLYLEDTDFGTRDERRPGLLANMWAQYLLDTCASVAEAVDAMNGIQVVIMEAEGHQATVHLALEDATGDSAVMESLDGRLQIHHDRKHLILTNEPPFLEQMRLLDEEDFSDPHDRTRIDGNVNPVARFQRAAYFSRLLPPTADTRQAVAGVLAIARNVSIPFGAPYEGFGLYNTEYRTVCDLTNRRYFFELSTAPNLFWISLTDLDFSIGAPVRMLGPDDISLAGEVSGRLVETDAVPF